MAHGCGHGHGHGRHAPWWNWRRRRLCSRTTWTRSTSASPRAARGSSRPPPSGPTSPSPSRSSPPHSPSGICAHSTAQPSREHVLTRGRAQREQRERALDWPMSHARVALIAHECDVMFGNLISIAYWHCCEEKHGKREWKLSHKGNRLD